MRAGRRLTVDGSAYEVFDAWSSLGGLVLCYFAVSDGEAVEMTDRGDRRAALEPDEKLADLSEDRLVELLAKGAPLTATERRFETPDEGCWLAQNIGPVWAEGVAAGLTGILFTDLAGSAGRRQVAGGPIAAMSGDDLLGLWAEPQRDSEPE
jgi:hypothetical protein